MGCLFAAAYHKLASMYHLDRTFEKLGEEWVRPDGLRSTNVRGYYLSNKLQKEDIPKITHEKKRLEHQIAVIDNLNRARRLAKCTIPVLGPFWVFVTEMDSNGTLLPAPRSGISLEEKVQQLDNVIKALGPEKD